MNPNEVTTTTGYGNRIMNAIVGVPVGLLLVFGSIFLLYWNEGRTDLSKIAKKSIPVNAQQVDSSANGKFVSVTGPVVTQQQLGDGAYLTPGNYLAVQRVVEEYAWVEEQSSQSHDNTGGSQTTTTTYTYKQQWTDSPADSSTFNQPTGHQNPAKPISDTLVRATSGKVGAYSIDPQTINLPSMPNVALSDSDVTLPKPAATQPATTATPPALPNLAIASPDYLFSGAGSLTAPQVGDIRISYKALPSGTNVTVFGLLSGSTLETYTDPQSHSIYHLLLGDRQTAIANLHNQFETLLWIFRGVGLLLLWIGLMMLMAPLDVILDFIPIAGAIGGAVTGLITLPLALLIGGTVILISYTLHHVLALIIGVPVVFVIGAGVYKLIKHGRGLQRGGRNNPATS